MTLQFEKVGQTLPWQEDESNLARNAAMAGLAGSPFLGLAGRERITKDPFFNRNIPRMSIKDLSRRARTGDVLLSASKGLPLYKALQAPVYGSDLFHGISAVGGGKFVDAGYLGKTWPHLRRGEKGRPSDPARLARMVRQEGYLPNLKELLGTDKYRDLVLLRPTAEARAAMGGKAGVKRLTEDIIEKSTLPYGKGHSKILSGLSELFVPKIEGAAGDVKIFGNQICKGEVCSTLPGQAMERAGIKEVVKGKPAKYLGSPDYLRSQHFEPVAARIGGSPFFSQRGLRLSGLGLRGALGAGLAGGLYAGTEDPALLGAVGAGALAGPELLDTAESMHKRMLERDLPRRGWGHISGLSEKAFPSTSNVLMQLSERLEPGGKLAPSATEQAIQKKWLRRTLPLQAAGALGAGGAAYYGLKEHPVETAGGIGAYLAAQKGHEQLLKYLGRKNVASGLSREAAEDLALKKFPHLRTGLFRGLFGVNRPRTYPGSLRGALSRTLPLKAGLAGLGGISAYGLAKLLGAGREKAWYEKGLEGLGVPGFTE